MTTKKRKETLLTGVSFAVLAAVLFGASTPFSKILLSKTEPVLLAGLLYLGSGVGLAIWSWFRSQSKGGTQEAQLKRSDISWLAGAILAGGIIESFSRRPGANRRGKGSRCRRSEFKDCAGYWRHFARFRHMEVAKSLFMYWPRG
jgi:hypothetical protein